MSIGRKHIAVLGIITMIACFFVRGLSILFLGYGAMSGRLPGRDRQYPDSWLERTPEFSPTSVASRGYDVRNTYYVSSRGENDNDGRTSETAFRTIGTEQSVP